MLLVLISLSSLLHSLISYRDLLLFLIILDNRQNIRVSLIIDGFQPFLTNRPIHPIYLKDQSWTGKVKLTNIQVVSSTSELVNKTLECTEALHTSLLCKKLLRKDVEMKATLKKSFTS